MRNSHKVLLSLIVSSLACTAQAKQENTMVLGVSSILANKFPQLTNGAKKLAKQAFKQAGINVRFKVANFDRILSEMDRGIIDGNLMRSPAIEKNAKNYVRVPEALATFQLLKIQRSDYQQANKKTSYAILKGDKKSRSLVKHGLVYEAKSWQQIVKLVDSNRVDQGIVVGSVAEQLKNHPHIEVHPIGPKDELFTYLNIRHKSWVPKIASQYQILKSSGSYQRFLKEEGLPHLYNVMFPSKSL